MFTLRWTKEAVRRYDELKDRAVKTSRTRIARHKTKSSKEEDITILAITAHP